jgi:hypothetical protein
MKLYVDKIKTNINVWRLYYLKSLFLFNIFCDNKFIYLNKICLREMLKLDLKKLENDNRVFLVYLYELTPQQATEFRYSAIC